MQALLVFLGGGLGSVSRFGISRAAQLIQAPNIWATLLVNSLGCFVLGFLASIFEVRALAPEFRTFFATGFLGGFTTFSAFGLETVQLLRQGQAGAGVLNLVLSLVLGLVLLAVGMAIGQSLQQA